MLTDRIIRPAVRPEGWQGILVLFGLAAGASALGFFVYHGEAGLVLGAVAAAGLLVATLLWPDLSALAVIFILYTNAAVVATRFHGLPYAVGAAVPVLLIVPLTNRLIFRRQPPVATPVLPPLLLWLAVQAIGTMRAEEPQAALSALTNFLIEGLGLYCLITNVVRTPAMLRQAIWALVIAGILMGGLSVYQQVTRTYTEDYGGFAQLSARYQEAEAALVPAEAVQPQLAGPIGEENRYAQVLLMLVPLALFRLWDERSRWLRGLAALAVALITLGVVLTFSRGAAVAFGLLLAVMGLLRYVKPYQMAAFVLGAGLAVAAVPQYGAHLISLSALTRVTDGSGLADADGSIRSRATENLAAALVFADHPIVGVGPGMFRYYYQQYADLVGIRVLAAGRQAHNLYLGVAAENGALGLACLLAIVVLTLRDLARARRRWRRARPELAGMAAGFSLAIVAYLATGFFLHFAYVRYFWLIMALAGAAGHIAAHVPEEAQPGGAEEAAPALIGGPALTRPLPERSL